MFDQTDWPFFRVAKSFVEFDNNESIRVKRWPMDSGTFLMYSKFGHICDLQFDEYKIYKFLFEWWFSVETYECAREKSEFTFFMNERRANGRSSRNIHFICGRTKSWILIQVQRRTERISACIKMVKWWPVLGRFDSDNNIAHVESITKGDAESNAFIRF